MSIGLSSDEALEAIRAKAEEKAASIPPCPPRRTSELSPRSGVSRIPWGLTVADIASKALRGEGTSWTP